MKIQLLYLSIIASTTVFGQIKVTGRVTNLSGKPISIFIYVNSHEKTFPSATYSGPDGSFQAETSSDSLILTFRGEGYKMKQIKLFENKTIEVKLRETFQSIAEFAADSSLKPLSKIENESGTTEIYSIKTLSINSSQNQKQIEWQKGDYKVYLPFDSLVRFLQTAPYRLDDMQFGLKYLQTKSNKSRISLSKQFLKRVGEIVINDFAIEMIKENSIAITDKKGNYIKQLILKDLFWNGYPNCKGCCWGGLQFSVGETSLFSQTSVIC